MSCNLNALSPNTIYDIIYLHPNICLTEQEQQALLNQAYETLRKVKLSDYVSRLASPTEKETLQQFIDQWLRQERN